MFDKPLGSRLTAVRALPGMPQAGYDLWRWACLNGVEDDIRIEKTTATIEGDLATYSISFKGVAIARYTIRTTTTHIERNFFWFPPANLSLPPAEQIASIGVAADRWGDAIRIVFEWAAVLRLHVTRLLSCKGRRASNKPAASTLKFITVGVGTAAAGTLGVDFGHMLAPFFSDTARVILTGLAGSVGTVAGGVGANFAYNELRSMSPSPTLANLVQQALRSALQDIRRDDYSDWFDNWDLCLSESPVAVDVSKFEEALAIDSDGHQIDLETALTDVMRNAMEELDGSAYTGATLSLSHRRRIPDDLFKYLDARLQHALQFRFEELLRLPTNRAAWNALEQRFLERFDHKLTRIARVQQDQLSEALTQNRLTIDEVRKAHEERREWQDRYIKLLEQVTPIGEVEETFRVLVQSGNLDSAASFMKSAIERGERTSVALRRYYMDFGSVSQLQYRFEHALSAYDRCIELYRRTQPIPEDERSQYSEALRDRAFCLWRLDRYADAICAMSELLERFSVTTTFTKWTPIEVGNIKLLDFISANVMLTSLLVTVTQPGERTYPDYQLGLQSLGVTSDLRYRIVADEYYGLMTIFYHLGVKPKEDRATWCLQALASGQMAVALYRLLAAASPSDFAQRLAWALNDLADCSTKIGLKYGVIMKAPDALAFAREAVDAHRKDSSRSTRGMAAALDTLGEAYEVRGFVSEALAAYRDGIDLLAPHFCNSPKNDRDVIEDLVSRFERLAGTVPTADVPSTLAAVKDILRTGIGLST